MQSYNEAYENGVSKKCLAKEWGVNFFIGTFSVLAISFSVFAIFLPLIEAHKGGGVSDTPQISVLTPNRNNQLAFVEVKNNRRHLFVELRGLVSHNAPLHVWHITEDGRLKVLGSVGNSLIQLDETLPVGARLAVASKSQNGRPGGWILQGQVD